MNTPKKIALFIVVLILVLGSVNYYYWRLQVFTKEAITQKVHYYANKPTLFMGSSHTAFACNDHIKGVYNVSARSEPYLFTLKKIQLLHPQSVVLHCNVQSFQYSFNTVFDKGLLSVPQFQYLMQSMTDDEKLAVYQLMNFETRCFYETQQYVLFLGNKVFRLNPNGVFGGWENGGLTSSITDANIENRFYEEFLKYNFQQSDFQLKYFEEILRYCQNNKIKLTLIATPLYPGFIKKIPLASFELFANQLAFFHKTYPFHYLDYTNFIAEKHCFFDPDHLNNTGATLFTKQVGYLY